MLKLNIIFCLLLVNFLSSFSSGGQTVLLEGGNEGEAVNQLKGNNMNSEQKYCRKEASLTQNNGPQIGAQTQVETNSETNVKSEKSTKTQTSDDNYSEQCSKESQKLGNVEKSQKEQVMDKTVQLKGGNEGEAGNQLGENKPSKIANSEKRYSLKEESMTPDSELKIGPQTPEKIQTDMNKHSESIASTHDIISGGISKELQKLGNVEISKKEPTKDTIKIFPKNKYDKESEVRDNPVSIGKRDTERLLPAVTGGVQRLCKQPDIFFFQKEPVFLTCQPDIKGTKEFKKDFKKASTKEKKNKQKPAVSRKGVSTPKQQNEKKFKVNYASKQCGATIVENNQEVENVNHIITSKKDEYLNNPCAANKKWFVIKLCETIYVKEIKTGSFELESSQPRDINVDVSDRYPAKEYHSLGVFQLTEDRKLHRFEIKRGDNYPAKYVKVEMLTHYGEEYFCPLTFFKVYGKPVELDAYDRDQEGKYIRDNIEEINPLNAGAKKVIDANYASSSEKIEPSEATAEKTYTNSLLVVKNFIDVIAVIAVTAVIAVLFISLIAVIVVYKNTCKLTSLSKDICALNRHGQYTTIERISAHESQQAEYVPHKTQPIVPDSESSNRSVNQAGNTTVHYDRNKNVNMAVSKREQYQSFSLDQDIVEDAVPESTDASIEHDVLLMYADKDKKNAETLHDLLKSNSNTGNLNVVLFDYFAPDVQNIFKITSCIFQRCRYLFILVTTNLRDDGVKRYQGQIALIDSIMKQRERVVPIWTEEGNNILPELSPLTGIPYIQGQHHVLIKKVEILFKLKAK